MSTTITRLIMQLTEAHRSGSISNIRAANDRLQEALNDQQ